MPHAFDGDPDACQEGAIKPSPVRSRYEALTPKKIALHDLIKTKAAELEALFGQLPELSELQAAKCLEQAVKHAICGIME